MAGSGHDAAIIEAILANEPDGWGRLLHAHGAAVRAVIRLVFDRYGEPLADEDLDETTLEVFDRVAAGRFQWLESLRTAEMLAPSLRALAAWRALGLLKSKYRVFTCSLEAEVKIGKSHVATAVLARPPGRERAPFMSREDVDRLLAAFMGNTTGRPVRILDGLYARGRSYADIAEREGVPAPSVAQMIFEERRRLGDSLAKAAPEAKL